MKNYSIWQDNIKSRTYPKLEKDIKVDVLIIGGGITGISTLYHLNKSSLNVILVEQNRIGMGITSRSTGKLSYLQNDLLDKIRISLDDKDTMRYINSQIDAIKLVKEIVAKEKIDCDLEKVNSKLYTNNENEVDDIKKLGEFFKKNNIKVKETESDLVKSKYMIEVDGTYIFHPVKFVVGLAGKCNNIYENTSVKKIIRKDNYYICYTNDVKIKTKYVIIASHYPYFNLPFMFPLKGTLEKSYLSASNFNHSKVSLISYTNPFISMRSYRDYLIYLSNSHSINKNVCDKKNFNELIKNLSDLNITPDYLWSNIDILTNDGLPYIGEIDNKMLIATGYNTWGLASGVLAGSIIRDIILKKRNDYVSLFDPKRNNLEQFLGGINSVYKNISGYVLGSINSKKKLKCPHMGCKLIYNEVENTFDCPCHGSRFDENGIAISAPANKNLFQGKN